jgi:hypothetical protein
VKTIISILILMSLSACAEIPTRQIDSSWSDEAKSAVLNKNITIGMTKDQVVSSWGHPWTTTKSISDQGNVEIWKYGLGQYAVKTWVVFYNDKVTRIVR